MKTNQISNFKKHHRFTWLHRWSGPFIVWLLRTIKLQDKVEVYNEKWRCNQSKAIYINTLLRYLRKWHNMYLIYYNWNSWTIFSIWRDFFVSSCYLVLFLQPALKTPRDFSANSSALTLPSKHFLGTKILIGIIKTTVLQSTTHFGRAQISI